MSCHHGRAHSEAKAQLLPSVTTRVSTTSSPSQDAASTQEEPGKNLRQLRKRFSFATLGRVALSSLTGILPLYFIVFAVLVYKQDEQLAEESLSQRLFQLAKAGPTIFSIMFAAIVGNFLKAIAASALERGTTVGSVECLMASRTVSTAATMPLRLRHLHPLVPALLVLWAMSPLGGQAALRVVSPSLVFINQTSAFSYYDTTPGYFALDGADDFDQYGVVVDTIFNAALISPAKSKNASYDLFDNLKFPMVEPLERTLSTDGDGWYNISQEADPIYGGLLGVPFAKPSTLGNSTFSMFTHYLYPNCSLTASDPGNFTGFTPTDYFDRLPTTMENVTNGFYLWIFWDRLANHTAGTPYPLMLYSWADTYTERGVYSSTVMTNATCELSISQIEQQVSCMTDSCNTTAVRRVTGPPDYLNFTGLYRSTASSLLFGGMINASMQSGTYHPDYSSPFEYYFAHPDEPFTAPSTEIASPTGWVDLSTIGDDVFSQRFAQLLNTYYLAGSNPYVISGNFSSAGVSSEYNLAYTPRVDHEGTITTSETVLRCHRSWLAVLVVTSAVMLLAGFATAVLDGTRRGPDILDAFSLALRDNRYVDLRCTSLQDGVEIAKEHKNARVRLGDVHPDEEVGHVAVGTITAEQMVKRLVPGRWYD